jgi:hypothetical protein
VVTLVDKSIGFNDVPTDESCVSQTVTSFVTPVDGKRRCFGS